MLVDMYHVCQAEGVMSSPNASKPALWRSEHLPRLACTGSIRICDSFRHLMADIAHRLLIHRRAAGQSGLGEYDFGLLFTPICPPTMVSYRIVSHRSRRKQSIFLAEILSHIRLSEQHNARRIQFPRFRSRSCRHTKSLFSIKKGITSAHHPLPIHIHMLYMTKRTHQRRIIHTQNHRPSMFRRIFTPPPHMRFHHMSSVQKWHFPILLHPHLVSRVRRNDV